MSFSFPKFSEQKLKKAELWVGLVVFLFFGGMTIAIALVGWQESWQSLQKISWFTLALASITALLSYAVAAWRWDFLSQKMGNQHIPHQRMWLIFGAGLALLPTPGKAGTALRCWLMNKQYQVPYSHSMPVMIVTMLHELLSALFLMCLLWVYLDGRLPAMVAMLLFGTSILLMLHPALSGKFFNLIDTLTANRIQNITNYMRDLLQNTQQLLHWRVFVPSFCSACIAWLLAAYSMWLFTSAMNLDVSFFLALAVFVFGILVGVLSFLPGGVGTAETVMVATLLASATMTSAEATVIVLLTRLVTLWIPVLLGFLLWPAAFKPLLQQK